MRYIIKVGSKECETVTLLHPDHCSILDGAQLGVAVQRDVPQPQREARAVAGDLVLHQHLVQLGHQHLTRNLIAETRGGVHTVAQTCSCPAVTRPNLKLKAVGCGWLNSDIEGGILRIGRVVDALINTLMEAVISAVLSVTERC